MYYRRTAEENDSPSVSQTETPGGSWCETRCWISRAKRTFIIFLVSYMSILYLILDQLRAQVTGTEKCMPSLA